MKGYLMQMQPFSVNDGDGIRTTIFLAGCPLHCKWCANPEGLRQHPVVGFYARLGIGCGACSRKCPKGSSQLLREADRIAVLCSNRDKGFDPATKTGARTACEVSCIACGLCVKTCPADAIHVEELHAVIDYERCLSCGACAVACPRHVIHDRFGILTDRR